MLRTPTNQVIKQITKDTININDLLPDGDIRCGKCKYGSLYGYKTEESIYPNLNVRCDNNSLGPNETRYFLTKIVYAKCLLKEAWKEAWRAE